MRRPLLATVVACAFAGVVLLVVNGRTWAAATVHPAGARQHVSVTGHTVAPALSALGIAALALAVAMLAASGVLRRVAGVLLVVVGAAAVPVAVAGHDHVGRQLAARAFGASASSVGGSRAAWWIVAVAAGVVVAVSGAAVALYGGRWRGMGSRYEAPAARPTTAATETHAWDALDRGQDPTDIA